MFVRVCKGLKDIGIMVPEADTAKYVNDKEPFFQSLYNYSQEGKDYFDKHGRIKGYKGEVTTSLLIFDIDSDNLEESRINTIRLIDHLKTRGLYDELAAIISFSGSKGYHVAINTGFTFSPHQLKKLCTTLYKEIEFVGNCKVDPSVYNTNRIFRIVNTLNEKSGLYKVDITESDLRERTTEEIMSYAKQPQAAFSFDNQIARHVVETVLESVKVNKKTVKDRKFRLTPRLSRNIEDYGCYLALQNGDMGHGESNAGLLRLAQFYRESGATREQTREKIVLAAHNRATLFPTCNEITDEKIDYEILGCIYDGEGYTFTYTDDFLKDKCRGKCLMHAKQVRKPVEFKEHGVEEKKPLRGFGFNARIPSKENPVDLSKRGFTSLKQSRASFDAFCDEMETSRVYTGIKEIDDATTIVPSGIVIINARPGVGKTSLMLNMLQNACYASEESNSPVLYSADMTEDEFYTKMMSKALRMTPDEVYDIQKNPAYTDIRQKGDDEVERIFGKARICYDKRLSVDRIRDDLNALREAGALPKTIFIDYVQKLVGCEDYGSGVQNLIELKALQGEFKINMILLSQIPRLGGDEETPVLTAAAAKGGSIYEETASIIMNMWRPMKHCPDNLHDDTLAIYIAKNRMGSCPPTIYLHFNGAHSEIRSKTPDELGIFKVNHAAYKEAKEEVKGPKRGKFR